MNREYNLHRLQTSGASRLLKLGRLTVQMIQRRTDGQKDSEWEGNHQPPGLIRGGKTSDPAVLMAQRFLFPTMA